MSDKDLQIQYDQMLEKLSRAHQEIKVKNEQISHLKESVVVLEDEITTKEERVALLRDRHRLMESEMGAKDDEFHVLMEQLQTAQMEIKVGGGQLGRKNERLQSEKTLLEDAFKKSKSQLEEVLVEFEVQKKELDELRKTVEDSSGAGQSKMGRQFFHNTCLLVKLLLAEKYSVQNVFVQDLYEEVLRKKVPMEEWPMYVYTRVMKFVN